MAIKIPVVAPIDLGRGIKRNESTNKYEVDLTEFVDGDTITYEDGKLKGTPSGLDCEAIADLPAKPWSKEVSLLASDSTGCYRVVAGDGLFVDLAVAFTKSDLNVVLSPSDPYKDKTYIATVRNLGTSTAKAVVVNFNIPLSDGVSLTDTQAVRPKGAEDIQKSSNTEYTIGSLSGGGSVDFEIHVRVSKVGSLAMSATVSNLLDPKLEDNNVDSIIAYINTESLTNYVATVDCPLVEVLDLTENKPLKTIGLDHDFVFQTEGWIRPDHIITLANAYGDGKGLSGRRFKITGSSQIQCFSTAHISNDENGHRGGTGQHLPLYTIGDYINLVQQGASVTSIGNLHYVVGDKRDYLSLQFTPDFEKVFAGGFQLRNTTRWDNPSGRIEDYTIWGRPNGSIIQTSDYTFDPETGVLEFSDRFTNDPEQRSSARNVFSLVIYFRPQHAGCNWQACVILFSQNTPESWKPTGPIISHNSTVSGVEFEYMDKDPTLRVVTNPKTHLLNWVKDPLNLESAVGISLGSALTQSRIFKTNARVNVKIQAGVSGSFTLTAIDTRLADTQLSGAITTSYNADNKTLTVTLNNPQINDSITTEFVNFIVE